MKSSELLAVLFPHFMLLHVSAVSVIGTTLRISACCAAPSAVCSGCGAESGRVHSRYLRSIADYAVGGQQAVVKLTVRRFFCDASQCAKKTFVEQVPDLTFRHGRSTVQLRRLREQVALALGGRAASRLTEVLAVGVGRDVLLRLIRALPDPPVGVVRVAGIDDFALRKGHVYGTVVVDVERGRPVDVLAERSADIVANWLLGHPGVEVICRDRAAYYAEGASRGAPAATQVADRWHLWNNLGQAAERAIVRLRPTWVPPPQPAPSTPAPAVTDARPDAEATERVRQRFAEVQVLAAKGLGRWQISKQLRIDPKTAARYLQADAIDDLRGHANAVRTRGLDIHARFLQQRWDEGVTSSMQLQRELAERGVAVSERTVRRYLQHMRPGIAKAKAPVPKSREVLTIALTHPDRREEGDKVLLKELRDRSAELDEVCHLVGCFAVILGSLAGEATLRTWVADAQSSACAELRAFATGLLADWDAVTAAVTMRWNSGVVEGHVNRIKMLKRQMFGRAKTDLLRKRVLLTS